MEENTPQKILRLAIESALNSEEDISSKEEDKQSADEAVLVPKRRGRKRIPEQWTRVISMRKDDPAKLKTYLLQQDLDIADSMARPPNERFHGKIYEPIFWPDEWVK